MSVVMSASHIKADRHQGESARESFFSPAIKNIANRLGGRKHSCRLSRSTQSHAEHSPSSSPTSRSHSIVELAGYRQHAGRNITTLQSDPDGRSFNRVICFSEVDRARAIQWNPPPLPKTYFYGSTPPNQLVYVSRRKPVFRRTPTLLPFLFFLWRSLSARPARCGAQGNANVCRAYAAVLFSTFFFL